MIVNINSYDEFVKRRLPFAINIPWEDIREVLNNMRKHKLSFFRLEMVGLGLFSKKGRMLPHPDEEFIFYANERFSNEPQYAADAFRSFGYKNVNVLQEGLYRWDYYVEKDKDFPLRDYEEY